LAFVISFSANAGSVKAGTSKGTSVKAENPSTASAVKVTPETTQAAQPEARHPAKANSDDFLSQKEMNKISVGATYGFNYTGVLSLHADYDIKDEIEAPVKVRVGWEHYSIDNGGYYGYGYGGYYSGYTESVNVYYGGAYYDFNKMLKISKKIHPFWGLGFGFGSVSCSACNGRSVGTAGGFYYIGGVQYDFTPKISGEASYNAWGGLTLGANYKF